MLTGSTHQCARVPIVLEAKGMSELVSNHIARDVGIGQRVDPVGLNAYEVPRSLGDRPREREERLVGQKHDDVGVDVDQLDGRLWTLPPWDRSSRKQPDLARV